MSTLSARLTLGFSCVAHAYTHLAMLLYATVVLTLEDAFAMSYADLQWLAVPGFVRFGVASLPAGWLGDRWSNAGMMAVFFFGLGGALILTGLATTPTGLMMGLALAG
ncbi:MAG: MFS transporter, partial [Rhodospirillaceae bacterium]|nr:MFS transporter [Rhodospirillaceae bacterium]